MDLDGWSIVVTGDSWSADFIAGCKEQGSFPLPDKPFLTNAIQLRTKLARMECGARRTIHHFGDCDSSVLRRERQKNSFLIGEEGMG